MLNDADHLVRVNGRSVRLSTLRAAPDRYARQLSEAKALVGFAECLCVSPPQKLVIRSRSGRFHLACWPEQGSKHSPSCDFHRLRADLSGLSGYYKEAITENSDGVRVRLEATLQLKPSKPGPVPRVTRGEREASGTRSAVGLLGLLHYLWERAQLASWTSGQRRTWPDCYSQLRLQTEQTWINRQPLDQVLYTVPPYRKESVALRDVELAMFRQRLDKHGTRGLILGEIKQIEPTKYGFRFSLRQTKVVLYASEEVVVKVERSHRSAFSKQLLSTSRKIALFLVESTQAGYLRVLDAAAMATTQTYIPGESSHELRMSDHLAESGRSYHKPLRYDGVAATFPDFVLTDTDPVTYVEVWGIAGRETYENRKAEKRAHYQRTGASLIEWNVLEELPPVTGRT